MNRRFADDDRCACRATEMVVHVVVDCSRLRVARRKLRDKVGDAFDSIASLLGGQPRNEQGIVVCKRYVALAYKFVLLGGLRLSYRVVIKQPRRRFL